MGEKPAAMEFQIGMGRKGGAGAVGLESPVGEEGPEGSQAEQEEQAVGSQTGMGQGGVHVRLLGPGGGPRRRA